MNIMELAIDQGKLEEGVKVFYDENKTCGAVVTQYMSAKHRASLAKYKASYQKELDACEKKGDTENIERISRRVLARSMADVVVIEIFGFEMPGENGQMIPIASTKESIFNLLTMPEFEAFYAWVVSISNETDTFQADQGAWEEIGKKLQNSSSTK